MDSPVFGLPEAADDFGFTAREQAQEMIEFINQIDPKGVAAMTQDWGGPTGIFATQMRPERIDPLIIGNTFSWSLIDVGARVFSSIMDGLLGRSSVFLFNGVARFFFTRGVVNKLPPDVLNMYLAPFKSRKMRYPTQIFSKQLMAAKSFLQELANGLSATKDKPALIIRGDSDFAFKERERNSLRAAFPNHRDIRLNGAGHLMQEDAPTRSVPRSPIGMEGRLQKATPPKMTHLMTSHRCRKGISWLSAALPQRAQQNKPDHNGRRSRTRWV